MTSRAALRASLLVVAASACAEPAIDMSLVLPQAAEIPPGFDLSCVTAVDVHALPVDDGGPLDLGLRQYLLGERAPCVDITPQTSFEGIRQALRGKVSMSIPDAGLAGIQLRGRQGSCNDTPNYHEAIFYGGAAFDGGDVPIELVPNISCAATTTYRVRPLDIATMVADPDHACFDVTGGNATFPGNVRPSRLGPDQPPLMFEAGRSVGVLAGGATTLETFTATAQSDACIAVAHEGEGMGGMACVNRGAPTLCGATGDIEVPIFNYIAAAPAIEDDLYQGRSVVIGTVWETGPNKPLANAKVTPASADAVVRYVELVNGQLAVTQGATATGPSGMFLVYLDAITGVTVTAPGHVTRAMTVGGGYEFDGSVLAVLPKQ